MNIIENVTVFTDASFCSETKSAGGAFWARGDVEKLSGSFAINGVTQSHEAEIIAACEAILTVLASEKISAPLKTGKTGRLILVIDCIAVRDAFEGRVRYMSDTVKTYIDKVKYLHDSYGFYFKINHVKAHKGTGTPRNWVNDWCDKEAKKQMVGQRKELMG